MKRHLYIILHVKLCYLTLDLYGIQLRSLYRLSCYNFNGVIDIVLHAA